MFSVRPVFMRGDGSGSIGGKGALGVLAEIVKYILLSILIP